MTNWTIKTLFLGYTEANNGAGLKGSIPFFGYYLTDGHLNILCDNGVQTGYFVIDKSPFGFPAFGEEAHMLKALKGIGVRPEDIDIVIYTHFHWDHVGNCHLFPRATHVFQDAEWKDYIDPLPSMKLMGVYDQRTIPVFKELKHQQRVAGDVQFLEGLELLYTPGHSGGHQCLRVKTRDGHYIISGDLFCTRFCAYPETTEWVLLDGTVTQQATPEFKEWYAKIFSATVFDHYAWYRSQIRIKALLTRPEFLIYSHEPSQNGREFG